MPNLNGSNIPHNLISEFRKRNGVFLVGAGFSMNAGLMSWEELLKPLADQLEIDIKAHDILDIPQFYLNDNAQGAFLLDKHITKEITKYQENSKSFAHEILTEIPIKACITTNYDQLLEKYAENDESRYEVIIEDDDLARTENNKIQLIKLNGCVSKKTGYIITKEAFRKLRANKQRICDEIRSIFTKSTVFYIKSTVFYIGLSFRDPVVDILYHEVLDSLSDDRRPHYFLGIDLDHHLVSEKKKRGIEVINLETAGRNRAEVVEQFLTDFKQSVMEDKSDVTSKTQKKAVVGGLSTKKDTKALTRKLIRSYFSTEESLVVDPNIADHRLYYDLVVRKDLLDYERDEFISIRRLKGVNKSEYLVPSVPYSETSEHKVTFREMDVQAIDYNTGQKLQVASVEAPTKRTIVHPFKIKLPQKLKSGEEFDIGFSLRLPGELEVIREDSEQMSISLARMKQGVGRLEFSVCLKEEPDLYLAIGTSEDLIDSIQIDQQTKDGQLLIAKKIKDNSELVSKLELTNEYHELPWQVTLVCDNPAKVLYIIHYVI